MTTIKELTSEIEKLKGRVTVLEEEVKVLQEKPKLVKPAVPKKKTTKVIEDKAMIIVREIVELERSLKLIADNGKVAYIGKSLVDS